jgi:GNAT superfamily N-acetyltransferase
MTAFAAEGFEPVEVRLRDDSVVTIRTVRVDDGERLQAAIRRLSPESRYSRFFSPLRELPAPLLARATHPDAERELQLVAVSETRAEHVIVAGARYAAAGAERDCEFAIAVVDAWHGRGLARVLLEALMRTARARGFTHMHGYVLATNGSMLGLAGKLGFVPGPSPEGPSVRLVRCDLAAVS